MQNLTKISQQEFDPLPKILCLDIECFDGGVEVLTREGFIRFDEYQGQDVAQYNEDGTVEFVSPVNVIKKPYSGKMIDFTTRRGTITTTARHTMVTRAQRGGRIRRWEAQNAPRTDITMFGGEIKGIDRILSPRERLAIALQADGHIVDVRKRHKGEQAGKVTTLWQVAFRKERKIERMKWILAETGITYGLYTYRRKTGQTDTIFRFHTDTGITKTLSDSLDLNRACMDMLEEFTKWGGSVSTRDAQWSYNSHNLNNTMFVQSVATLCGRTATYVANNGGWKLSISKSNTGDIRSVQRSEKTFDGTVYCVEVPSHMIIVKGGQQTLVTGNCSPSLIWAYSLWNANAVKVERDPTIMSISWQWVGTNKTENFCLRDMSEEELANKVWDLYNEADYVLGHNSNKFDNKMVNAMFMRYDLTPPSPYKQIDTLQVARSVARFNSNKLDNLGHILTGEGKTDITYKDLWYDCLVKNDKKSWAKMIEYNNRDVDVTVALYKKLRPWIKNHPNIGDHTGIDGICPKCGSDNIRKDGSYRKRSGRVQRYKCLHCGGWSSEASVKKEGRLVNV